MELTRGVVGVFPEPPIWLMAPAAAEESQVSCVVPPRLPSGGPADGAGETRASSDLAGVAS